MDPFWSLVIGIVSSLVATALFLGFAEFFRRSLLPWYIDKLYRGVRIDGTWTLHMMDGKSIKFLPFVSSTSNMLLGRWH
jgi:hypothetical protein